MKVYIGPIGGYSKLGVEGNRTCDFHRTGKQSRQTKHTDKAGKQSIISYYIRIRPTDLVIGVFSPISPNSTTYSVM